MSELKMFLIIDYDGWNVVLRDDSSSTFLEFDSYEDALEVAKHWEEWISK